MAQTDYTRAQLAAALERVGLRAGDTVFCHSNIGFFGVPEGGMQAQTVYQTLLGAFFDVLGEEGTLVLPTFTYSFPRGETYDPQNTPSTCGIFTEMLRRDPCSLRSLDPSYSVAAIGRRARELTRDVPQNSFGDNCFFERFLNADGIICNLNFDAGSTFIHYVERRLKVPYRYDKAFRGTLIEQGRPRQWRNVIHVMDLGNELTLAEFEPFDRLAREQGIARSVPVGRGAVVALRARDTFDLLAHTLPRQPWLLTLAGKKRQAPQISPYTEPHGIRPVATDSIDELQRGLDNWPLLGLVPGVEAALRSLKSLFESLHIQRLPTGTAIGELLVPEYWWLESASLQDDTGRLIIDQRSSPHLVPSHGRSFEGEVTREELLQHLVYDPERPQSFIPATLLEQNRWGLSLPASLVGRLRAPRYRVNIQTRQRFGALPVGVLSMGDVDRGIRVISVTLDSRQLLQALAWFQRLQQGWHTRKGLVLLIHPGPFSAKHLIPRCLPERKVIAHKIFDNTEACEAWLKT